MEGLRRCILGLLVTTLAILFAVTCLTPPDWQDLAMPGWDQLRTRLPARPSETHHPRHTLSLASPAAAGLAAPTLAAPSWAAPRPAAPRPQPHGSTVGVPGRVELQPAAEGRMLVLSAAAGGQNEPQDASLLEAEPPSRRSAPAVTPLAPIEAPARPAAAEPADRVADGGDWQPPRALIEQLKYLDKCPAGRRWARATRALLDELTLPAVADMPPSVFEQLRLQLAEGQRLAESLPSGQEQTELLRACYALARRLDVWEPVQRLRDQVAWTSAAAPSNLSGALEQVERRLAGEPHAASWREFLLLDELATAAGAPDVRQQRQLARRTLARLDSPRLTREQLEHLGQPPLATLIDELRHWAAEPLDVASLVRDLEQYELQPSSAGARRVASTWQLARWSDDGPTAELATRLGMHYRNANLRLAVSSRLINRLLPEPPVVHEPIQDELLGALVTGNSQTRSRLQILLVPDRRRWQFGLEALGDVQAETSASRWPATFYNHSNSDYRVRKLFAFDRLGMFVSEAQAQAQTRTGLRHFETDFDNLPLVGSFVRGLALQRHDSSLPVAQREAERKVADRAAERMNAEVRQRLETALQWFSSHVLAPLDALELNPSAIEMQTTDQRLIVRYRLAGADQLAAHTPRPRAYADSLMSLQVHESAVNNLIEQLQLAGRRIELHELYRHIFGQFREVSEVPDEIPADVHLQFAAEQPVRIACHDGSVLLTIRLAELETDQGERWQDLAIYARYAPQLDGLEAELVRDGPVQLSGHRLSFRDQVTLRSIFTKVLSRSRTVPLVPEALAARTDLDDLAVTQAVIVDGWIGVAIGPRRSPSARLAAHHDR